MMSTLGNKLFGRFIGSWSLVSYQHVLPSGDILKPFGDSPLGLILYQADGRMSVHISTAAPAKFASDDFQQASLEEAAEAWRGYFGYWGSFKVETDKGIVVHRVRAVHSRTGLVQNKSGISASLEPIDLFLRRRRLPGAGHRSGKETWMKRMGMLDGKVATLLAHVNAVGASKQL